MENQYSRIKQITQIGLFSAITYLVTWLLPIQLGASSGSLTHLGNVPVFIAIFLVGSRVGALSGAIGMGLFDLFSPYALWAPFTFIIRLIMGYMIGMVYKSLIKRLGSSKAHKISAQIMSVTVGGIWMIFGYYITEGILYGNWLAPMYSIPANVIQIIVGLVGAIPITVFFRNRRL